MLHILFLILKIIGIILAVILGILLLLICVILFVPVCYQGSAKCDGKIESLCAILKVTWLFNLIQVNVKYENGNLKYSVRIAWKKIIGGKNHEKAKDNNEQEKEPEQIAPEPVANQEMQEVAEKCEERIESLQKEIEREPRLPERIEEKSESSKEKSSIFEKIKDKVSNIKDKLNGFLDKIKCTLKNIYDKLKILSEKNEKIMQFIQDENHITAFLKLKKELFKLLKRLRPKKIIVKVRYGFDDPSLTGKILAGLSMLYPFTEEHMEIVPDFEEKVLEGRMMVGGRIYTICFICTAWNLFWCKQIRILYKDVRNFKF